MPHTYECQMRWADMDLLGHVNNVTYLDYVAEARHHALAAGGHQGPAPRVARHRVEFVRPLVHRREPVLVDTWAAPDTDPGDGSRAVGGGDAGAPRPDRDGRLALQHEVYDVDADGERVVHLRVSTDLEPADPGSGATVPAHDALIGLAGPADRAAHGWRPVTAGARRPGDEFALSLRVSDLDGSGHASDVKLVEYFQESRIQYFGKLQRAGAAWSHHVVARTDLEVLAPVPHRARPYAVRSWVAHVGNRSFTLGGELLDGDRPLARAAVVMVTFDKETQRTRPMDPAQRERLEQELARGGSASA